MQAGWEQSAAPAAIHVPYGSGNADFDRQGNFPSDRPGGHHRRQVDHDANANGRAGCGRSTACPGWLISLSNGAAPDTTGADGGYAFTGLRPSDTPYTVLRTQQARAIARPPPAPAQRPRTASRCAAGRSAGPLAISATCAWGRPR